MDKQTEFVLRTIEERDIRFVRLWFTDVLGYLKSVAIAPAELEGAFAEGIGFDGSAIEGFARVYESDMLAKPDPGTFQVLPWRGESQGVARMFCDILMPDGSPSFADPRYVLKRTLSRAADLGFTFYTHPEIEFFLFKEPHRPGRGPGPGRRGRLLRPHARTASGYDFRRQAITMLEAMGISVEFSHHEGGPGQQEIDLRYADALTTADNIMTFRLVVKEVALEQGVYATFMPKPLRDHPGSGMHTHLSLFEGDRNAFFEAGRRAPADQGRPGRSSPGSCTTRPRSPPSPTSGSTPTSGSSAAARHRRGSAGATTTAAPWCACRCTSRTRATPRASSSARWTPRPTRTWPSPLLLAAGLKGIEEGYELPAGRRGRRLGADQRRAPRAGHRRRCRRSLNQAIQAMERSELVAETLGEHVFDFFLRNKRAEWEEYRRQVTQFELDRYLPVL